MSDLATPDAVDASSPSISLDSLSPAELSAWKETGKLPDAPAASSPAPESETPAETSASPVAASEPAPPAKKGAETRKAELAAEIQTLLKQRADLRRELETPTTPAKADVPADSSPAPVVVSDKPTWATFEAQIGETYATWAEAQDAYIDAQYAWRDVKASEQRTLETKRTQAATVIRTHEERIAAHAQQDATFWDQVSDDIKAMQPWSAVAAFNPKATRTPQHDIADVIIASEVGPHLMLHLSRHSDVLQSLLASPSPEALHRAMGRIEASLQSPAQVSTPAPPVRPTPVSSAPPPPVTLGSKPAVTADEVDAAIAAGDFRAYRAAMNAREIAQRR